MSIQTVKTACTAFANSVGGGVKRTVDLVCVRGGVMMTAGVAIVSSAALFEKALQRACSNVPAVVNSFVNLNTTSIEQQVLGYLPANTEPQVQTAVAITGYVAAGLSAFFLAKATRRCATLCHNYLYPKEVKVKNTKIN